MESDLVQWLILVAVIARLHLRLLRGVVLVRLGPGLVDEPGFYRWPLLGVLRVKVGYVWNWRCRLFANDHKRLLSKFMELNWGPNYGLFGKTPTEKSPITEKVHYKKFNFYNFV